MSQAFKRLTLVSSLDKPLICKQGLSSWLHQCYAKPVEPYFYSRGMGGKSNLSRQWHAQGYHTALKPLFRHMPNHSTSGTGQMESQRTMSILTDLLKRKKKYDEEDEVPGPDDKIMPLFEDTPKSLTEEEIEAKRNKSRLNPIHQKLIKGEYPYTEPMAWFHHTVKFKRRMFGRYGESSGVNPGLLWPTKEELKEQIEYEKICHPFTIQELVEKKQAQRQAEQEAVEQRIKEVEAKMAIVDQYKEDLARRTAEKEREASEAKARREKLVEEVRRHFGYTVDPREEKFQELLAKKEKEQKKNMKEARRLEKEKKMLQKLEGKPSGKEAKPSKSTEETEEKDDI